MNTERPVAHDAAVKDGRDSVASQITAAKSICPVVVLKRKHPRVGLFPLRPRRIAVCPDLPAPLLEEIATGINALGLRSAATVVRPLLAKYELATLAILDAVDAEFTVPPPFTISFEPLGLDERNPDLATLYDHSPGEPRPRMRKLTAREVLQKGIELAIVLVAWLLIPLSMRFILLAVLAPLLTILVIRIIYQAVRPRWMVVPGGVMVPRWFRSPHLYTPGDTLLVVRNSAYAWCAILHRDRQRRRAWVSDLETSVLLAAWQSPLVVPREE